jgi:hypothetical protein
MAYVKRELTKDERVALKPAFEKVETAVADLQAALARVRPHPPEEGEATGSGICGLHCGCSSFDGPGTSMLDKCRRPFCKHSRLSHST